MAIVEKRIFLFQGAGRSGLELIVSLLDGHEESLCLPFTLKFLNIWKTNKLDLVSDKEIIIDTFLNKSKLKRFEDDRANYGYVDIKVFKNTFKNLINENNISFKNTFNAIFYSYALSIKKDISKIKVFFADSYYHYNEIEEYLKYFSNLKFIRIIRDPRSNIFSLTRHLLTYQKTMHPPLGPYRTRTLPVHILKDIMLQSFKFSTDNEIKYKSIYKIIKYEDALNSTENLMRDLCSWVGIKYNKILLETTRNKIKYSTFSKTKNKIIDKIEKDISLSWLEEINSLNLRAYEFIFLNILKKFHYKLAFKDNKTNKILGFLSCLYPWESEFVPKLIIIDKKNKRINYYNFFKALFFFFSNIFGFFISRLKLYFYILRGDFFNVYKQI